ncbi:hypothetical protein [Flavobacterium sp.]|jgi:hypothetical protein|uniref:hypothetical protein n=1 Tax=Flavobacterium sp. TaxID=239 RepID=UPI0026348D00|nr:hypothetical protein [Flavobacterium sp.]
MNATTQNISGTKIQKRTLVFLVVLVFSSFGMFGQEVQSENTNNLVAIPETAIAYESEMDLVNWFMSTKQHTIQKEEQGVSKATTKKQMITSGSQPNKVLYRTFLKRIAAQEAAVA